MKKKLIFKKGVYTIRIPFMLNNLYSWQEQVSQKMQECKSMYIVRKSAKWGFTITENGAEINCYKK